MAKRNHDDLAPKIQAVRLALEISQSKTSAALSLPENTMDDWMHTYRQEKNAECR